MVRAKFCVRSVEHFSTSPDGQKQVRLFAVYDTTTEENRRYAKATPSGEITMLIDNPPAVEQFQPGKTFYVDFTETA